MIQADTDVLCAGTVADVFVGGSRAVLSLWRDGAPAAEILVIRGRRHLYAVINRCPHMDRALDDAKVRGRVITCRGHGRSYSLRSGRRVAARSWCGPAVLRRVRAWDEGGRLFLDVAPVRA